MLRTTVAKREEYLVRYPAAGSHGTEANTGGGYATREATRWARVWKMAAARVARQVAARYCYQGNLCSYEMQVANRSLIYYALITGGDVSELELQRESTEVPPWDPFHLLTGAGSATIGKAGVRVQSRLGGLPRHQSQSRADARLRAPALTEVWPLARLLSAHWTVSMRSS
jgi:hypothetical protein